MNALRMGLSDAFLRIQKPSVDTFFHEIDQIVAQRKHTSREQLFHVYIATV